MKLIQKSDTEIARHAQRDWQKMGLALPMEVEAGATQLLTRKPEQLGSADYLPIRLFKQKHIEVPGYAHNSGALVLGKAALRLIGWDTVHLREVLNQQCIALEHSHELDGRRVTEPILLEALTAAYSGKPHNVSFAASLPIEPNIPSELTLSVWDDGGPRDLDVLEDATRKGYSSEWEKHMSEMMLKGGIAASVFIMAHDALRLFGGKVTYGQGERMLTLNAEGDELVSSDTDIESLTGNTIAVSIPYANRQSASR